MGRSKGKLGGHPAWAAALGVGDRCSSWKFGLRVTGALALKACGALVPDSSLSPDPALSLCSSPYRGRVFPLISLGS